MNNSKTFLKITMFCNVIGIFSLFILGLRMLISVYGQTFSVMLGFYTICALFVLLGWAHGMRQSDSTEHSYHNQCYLLISGVWLLVVPALRAGVLPLLQNHDPLWATPLSAVILFAVPFWALARSFVTILRRLAILTQDPSRQVIQSMGLFLIVGLITWILLATLGIPFIGVARSCAGVGILILAVLLLPLIKKIAPKFLSFAWLLFVVLLLGVALFMPREIPALQGGELARLPSLKAEIRVVEEGGSRTLFVNGEVRGRVSFPGWQNQLSNVAVMELAHFYFSRMGKVLVIGLGDGSVARAFLQQGWKVEVIESDPNLIAVAQRYFAMDSLDGTVRHVEAYSFLRNTPNIYQVIILDLPATLMDSEIYFTREFFGLVSEHLATDGLCIVNVTTLGWDSPLIRSVSATLKLFFSEILAFPIAEPPNTLGDVVLFAANKNLQVPDEWIPHPGDFLYDDYLHWYTLQKFHAWYNRFQPDERGATILSADKSTMGLESDKVNRGYRIERVGGR